MIPIPLSVALAAIGATSAFFETGAPARWTPSAAWVAAAADANRDGSIDAAERAAFVAALPHADRLATDVDRSQLLARLFATQLDSDGDHRVTVAEIEALREFALAPPPEVPPVAQVAPLVVRAAAEVTGDDLILPVEWDAFVAGLDATVSDRTLDSWLATAKSRAPKDREALNAGVLVLSIESGLDGDRDGRITSGEIDRLLADLDQDGDGVVAANERIPADAGAATPWRRLEVGGTSPGATTTPVVRIAWQRDLDDALALVKTTGLPLLICVNMDGEAASDALALGRYHDPQFARLANSFVPLIVSPDLHAPRERDDFGRRLPDPRFGRVLCQEHIDAEPALYERWFAGRRVAPRHVGVAPDGSVLFDVYLVNDLGVIDETLERHAAPPIPGPRPETLTTDELLVSPDAACRDELESRFLRLAPQERLAIATRALARDRSTQHPEILRLAFRDEDSTVRAAAVRAFAGDVARFRRGPFEWFSEAFRAAGDDGPARRLLADAVLAPDVWPDGDTHRTISKNARTLARASVAVGLCSDWLPLAEWRTALAAAPAVPSAPPPIEADAPEASAVLADVERLLESGAPGDPAIHEQAADRMLAAFRAIREVEGDPLTLVQDAFLQASAACAVPDPTPSALVVLAEACELSEDPHAASAAAARALPALASRASDALVVRALRTFVRAKKTELYAALTAEREWPATWLSDLCAAHELLLLHPLGGEDDAVEALAFLNEMDLRATQARFVRLALARFSMSGRVQEWFRFVVLRDHGAAALEREAAALAASAEDAVELDWYHALAVLEAAGRHAEDRRTDAAIAANKSAADRFESCARRAPAFAESSIGYAQKALFAAAELLRARGDAASADTLERHAKELAP